jgi:hypothetical protein
LPPRHGGIKHLAGFSLPQATGAKDHLTNIPTGWYGG